MYIKLIHEVTMYSGIDGPQTFPAGTVMHCTPISKTMVKTRWGYLYVGDFEIANGDTVVEGSVDEATRKARAELWDGVLL